MINSARSGLYLHPCAWGLAEPENAQQLTHPATIANISFIMSNKWFGSLGLASNVKCS